MSQLAVDRSAPVPAPRPTVGAYVWFVGMVGSWVAFGVLALASGDALSDLWAWVRGLPLVAEIVLWVLTLPWMLALAVWESSWEESLRILVVVLIAGAWTIVSIPRARESKEAVRSERELMPRSDVANTALDVETDPRREALRRLNKKRDFRAHLLAFVLVNGFLWLIWGIVYAFGGPVFPWPVFPLFGWGIGLSFHAWDAYGRRPFSEEEIEREVARVGQTR